MTANLKVMKFGGTSVGRDGAMERVLDIICDSAAEEGRVIVVSSALSGVTDELINMAKLAKEQNILQGSSYYSVVGRHFGLCKQLSKASTTDIEMSITALLEDINSILACVKTLRELSPRTLDLLMSYGEKLSCTLLAKLLTQRGCPAEMCDATQIVKTNSNFGGAAINDQATEALVKEYFLVRTDKVQIVTGFCGSTADGETTTLGRGGGDYTASIIGAILKADVVEVWTDVDGVLTAHPKIVNNPLVIQSMAYEEAMEMSYFGAKVIYAPTMGPVMRAGVPLHIRNTFNREAPGTVIRNHPAAGVPEKGAKIRAISSVEEAALVILKGTSMVGVAGTAGRLFSALAREKVSVILISQASSEHSICLAVAPQFARKAQEAIEEEFDRDIERGNIDRVVVTLGLSVLAVVGCRFSNATGLAGLVTTVLGENDIEILAIAQGSTDLNFSLVVQKGSMGRAIQLIHHTFFPEQGKAEPKPPKVVHVFLATMCLERVGEWRQHLLQKLEATMEKHRLRLKLVGVLDSGKRRMLLSTEEKGPGGVGAETGERIVRAASTTCMLGNGQLSSEQWEAASSGSGAFVEAAAAHALSSKTAVFFVDDSQDDALPSTYDGLLSGGVTVLTCNRTMWRLPVAAPLQHPQFFWSLATGISTGISAALLSCRADAGDECPEITVRAGEEGLFAPLHALSGCECGQPCGAGCLLRKSAPGDSDVNEAYEVTIVSEEATTTLCSSLPTPLPSLPLIFRRLVSEARR